MRSKSSILDKSEKVLLTLPPQSQLMREHEHLFLEVLIDIRNRLTLMNSGLQALNKYLATWLPKPPQT